MSEVAVTALRPIAGLQTGEDGVIDEDHAVALAERGFVEIHGEIPVDETEQEEGQHDDDGDDGEPDPDADLFGDDDPDD